MSDGNMNPLANLSEAQIEASLEDALNAGIDGGENDLLCKLANSAPALCLAASVGESVRREPKGIGYFQTLFSVVFYAGWRAREALMESEDLERMVR